MAAMLTVVMAATLLNGCGNGSSTNEYESALDVMENFNSNIEVIPCEDNYRTTYEVFVYSFCDSDGDGIGDLNGLTSKLDYIEELGCNAIWLMPIMPSPTYHKYDITDYYGIDPQYGTMADFENLITNAHARNIHIYIDTVINHTSSEHPWFKEACDALASGDLDNPYIEYYNFTEDSNGGFEKVPGIDDLYYEARFWSGMPDLNLDNPAVRNEIEDIVDFWIKKGVDGFRMDACTSYYTGKDKESIDFLTWFKDYVKSQKSDVYIVSEVWTDSITYSKYLASGIDSTFEFRFSQDDGVIAKALNKGEASSYGKALVAAQDELSAANPAYIGAPFYTNHDTARTAGYYAGDSSIEKTKLGWAMSLLMSGNSFLYYGEELGIKGSGDDENKRTQMRWVEDSKGEGMCYSMISSTKQKFDSLELQQEDPDSLYHFVKQAIKVRNSSDAITHGKVTFIEELSDSSLCVIQKDYQNETVTIVFNLSDTTDELDLSSLGVNSIAGVLVTNKEAPALDKGSLEIPGYSIVVLN